MSVLLLPIYPALNRGASSHVLLRAGQGGRAMLGPCEGKSLQHRALRVPALLLPDTILGRVVVPKVSVFLIYSEFHLVFFSFSAEDLILSRC